MMLTSDHDRARRYADILGDERDPAVLRLAVTLDRCYKDTPPPHLDAAIRQAVRERATRPRLAPNPAPQPAMPRWSRRRLVVGATSVALAVSGLAGYLNLSGSIPVSAQTVLRRAAAAHVVAPGEAAHLIYTVTTTDGYAGTGDVWIAADTYGALRHLAQTLTMDRGGITAPALGNRTVQSGPQTYTYSPSDNTIRLNPSASAFMLAQGVPSQAFNGAWVAQRLSQLVPGAAPGVQVSPHQPLDGSTVDAVTFTRGATRATFYFDAQSYLLRGFDLVDASGRTWQARLSSDAAMALAAVPAATFLLKAPASARVIPPHPVPGANPGILMDGATFSAFADACHLPDSEEGIFRLKTALAGRKSLLAACQRTAPAVDQAALVAALTRPNKASLDAAVVAGQITPAQAGASLAALHAQLTTWVTAPWPHR